MEYKYIVLGIIQGLTEFFPVSSSAHLAIMQKVLGVTAEAVVLCVVLHLGTVSALIIFFFKDILKVLRDKKLLGLILIVTIITGIIGVGGKDFFETLFSSTKAIATALIFTGLILILTKKSLHGQRNNLNTKDATILGITQGIAIIPGISRSGITISTLLFRKIGPDMCLKFSFLASMPAVLGAAIWEAKDINFALKQDARGLILGFIFSLLTGILSLWMLKIIIGKAKLYYFGYYCILVAVVTLLFIK